MAISSINFAKSSGGSFAHNDRSEKEPDYLLPVEHRLENECNRSAPEAQKMLENLFENAKENYSKTYGQKFQTKFENAHWEAVINLNKEHTIKDVERLVREIEKETGFTEVQIAIHRDEGRINEKTAHPIYNLHAHVNFSTLDKETGRQLYRRSISNSEREKIRKENGIPDGEKIPKHLTAVMDKAKLSKLQDITARELGMERGQKGSEKVRLGHKQYRAVEQEKEKLLEKIDELQKENTELRYSFRDMQKQITAIEAPTEDKKELHRLNTEINKMKIEGATKDLKISELEAKMREIEEKNTDLSKSLETVRSLNRYAESEKAELRAQNIAKDQTIDQLKNDSENTLKITQPIHEPINASKIAKLLEENEILQITNKALETEVSELKENRAVGDISKEIEEAHSKIGEMARIATSNAEAIEELEKELPNRDPKKVAIAVYNSHIVADTGIMGKFGGEKKDTDLLIANMAKEIEKRDKLLKRAVDMLKNSEITRKRVTDSIKNVVESSKKHLEAIFSKITGKSLPEVKKEREELVNAKPRGLREAVDELNKQKEPEKGIER
ncbi:MAG: hypothetical protein Q8M39_05170 [Sulfuricurvum sp.]|nr:hypothetical protein [Sulfuricurvum sp.]